MTSGPPEFWAIGGIFNAMPDCSLASLPSLSASTCTNGSPRSMLSWSDYRRASHNKQEYSPPQRIWGRARGSNLRSNPALPGADALWAVRAGRSVNTKFVMHRKLASHNRSSGGAVWRESFAPWLNGSYGVLNPGGTSHSFSCPHLSTMVPKFSASGSGPSIGAPLQTPQRIGQRPPPGPTVGCITSPDFIIGTKVPSLKAQMIHATVA